MFLIIHPPSGTWDDITYIPYGLLSIKGALEENRCDIELLDLELLTRSRRLDLFSDKFFEDSVKLILDKNPTIVGFGTIVSNFHIVISLCKRIKSARSDMTIVLGGPQASALAEETFNNFHDYIDIIVIGEGEKTIVNLARSGFDRSRFKNIDGIAFWRDCPIKTRPAGLIEDLDSLSEIDTQHLKKYKDLYDSSAEFHSFFADIEVGRGCRFNCSFCSTAPFWRRVDRKKSPERVYAEMERLSHLTKSFPLTHDNLTSDKEYLYKLCNYFIEKNIPYKWTASSRGDVLSKDELELMKRAGCEGLFIGMESGSKHIQSVYNKNLNLKKCRKLFEWCNKLGVDITSSFVIGHPEETLDDLNNTLSMILDFAELKNTSIDIKKICAYAGSKDYYKYLDQIKPTENTSTGCRRPFRYPETEELIRNYPKIFANFGAFPCQYMSDIEISILVEIFNAINDKYPRLVKMILNEKRMKPTDIFDSWMEWYIKNHEGRVLTQDWIRNTLPTFFRERLINT